MIQRTNVLGMEMNKQRIIGNAIAVFGVALISLAFGDNEFKPKQSKLPAPPPQDSVVLFDGKTNRFLNKNGKKINWPIQGSEMTSAKGESRSNHIVSQIHFRDADIHVEFKLPTGGSGNSGVYIHGNYEIQIINSVGKKKTGQGDCGALYGFHAPQVNACRKPEVWQVLDIRFVAPRRDKNGMIVKKGVISAWLNEKLVLDKVEFGEPKSKYHPYRYNTSDYLKTIWTQQKKSMVGPLFLQDHDNAVTFRNVWIRPRDKLSITYQGSNPSIQKNK